MNENIEQAVLRFLRELERPADPSSWGIEHLFRLKVKRPPKKITASVKKAA